MSLDISVTGSLPRPEIEFAPAAYEARRAALAKAESVANIDSVCDLDNAADALKEIASIRKGVETSRKDVKAPVLEVGRRIDSIAKDYLDPLDAQHKRLSTLIGSYQEAARAKAQREREEAAREQERALAEMREKMGAATTEEEIDSARHEAADRIAAAQVAAINAEGAKADGLTTRSNWKFEVEDIRVLFAARPELCIIEPNNAAIRAIVKNGQPLPGVRIWREAAAIVRGTAPVKLEDYDY
jgi:hypothetical protein